MKKIIVFLFIISLFILLPKDKTYITDNKIRYRIIANSNSTYDQQLKWEINKKILPIVTKIDYSDNKQISNNLDDSIKEIKSVIDKYNITYDINYGQNYFPEKKYYDKTFPSGNYQSLVIKLGESKGDNWWCFLFPPLCNADMQKIESNDLTYDLYIHEVLNKYF